MMTYEQQQKYKLITTRLHSIGVVGPTEQILALANEVKFYRKKVQELEEELRKERGMQGFVEELRDDMLEHLPKEV